MIAADHEFGSQATELKLSVVEAYLHAFTTELRGKFSELWYIDAFAGTGARSAYLRAAEVSSARGRQKALSDDEDQQRSLSTSSQRLTDSYSSKSANVPSTRYEKCEINTLAGTSMSSRATLTTKSASIGKQRAMPPRSRNYTPQDNAVFSLTRHHYGEQRTSEHYKITLGQDSKQSSRRCCHRCPYQSTKSSRCSRSSLRFRTQMALQSGWRRGSQITSSRPACHPRDGPGNDARLLSYLFHPTA